MVGIIVLDGADIAGREEEVAAGHTPLHLVLCFRLEHLKHLIEREVLPNLTLQ